jgi:hypothetical protein
MPIAETVPSGTAMRPAGQRRRSAASCTEPNQPTHLSSRWFRQACRVRGAVGQLSGWVKLRLSHSGGGEGGWFDGRD